MCFKQKVQRFILTFLILFYLQGLHAQCMGCTINVSDNSTANYTVMPGQILCIAGNFTYTGHLTLNGGSICNNGTVTKIVFKSGIFRNTLNGKISATSKDDFAFKIDGKTVLDNLSGSQVVLSDSLNISSTTSDSIIFNIHKGSSLNCDNLNFKSGNGFFNIGLAATTTTNSDFITSLNVNGNAKFKKNVNIEVKELSSMNVNGTVYFKDQGTKKINNYGVINVTDSLVITGDGGYDASVLLNNYGEFSVFGSLDENILHSVVQITNYPALPSSVLYAAGSLNLSHLNSSLYSEGALQADNVVYISGGATYTNNSYLTVSSLLLDAGTITNNSIIFVSANLTLGHVDGTLNNNGAILIESTFRNSGHFNMSNSSILSCKNFYNESSGFIVSSADDEYSVYARIYVSDHSSNSGSIDGRINFKELSPGSTEGGTPKYDEYGGESHSGKDVISNYVCEYELEVGFIYGVSGPVAKRPRYAFCPGENFNLAFSPNVPLSSGPTWNFSGISAFTPYTTGLSVPVYGVISGGIVNVSGTYWNGKSTCNYSVDFLITVGNGSISTSSPTYFGSGNPVALHSTVTVGAPPYSYTWTPNYFFVSPTSNHDIVPLVDPQVSMVYTVNMKDGYGCTATNTLEVIGEPFARLEKELNGNYYNLFENKLLFTYEEQYAARSMEYYVYNGTHSVVASHSGTNVMNTLAVAPGDNRLSLNMSSSGFSSGYYILEVINGKKEKSYLRFKK